jgi:hypothetical protein
VERDVPTDSMIASQTEFGLSVAVCAWCKPHEYGQGIGAVSHGICLRHLRNLKLEVQGLLPQLRRGPPLRRRLSDRVSSDAQLSL